VAARATVALRALDTGHALDATRAGGTGVRSVVGQESCWMFADAIMPLWTV